MTSWQDIVFTLGGLVFAVALVPTLLAKAKPPILTSATTGVCLGVFCVADVSLRLYGAAAVMALTAAMWAILAVQASLS